MSTWVSGSTATEASYSVENNTSTVTVNLYVGWNGGSWAEDNPAYYITINGNTKWGTANFNTGESSSGSQWLASHTVTVPHNSDGTGSCNWSVGYEGIYAGEGRYSTYSSTLTLTTIPRASKIVGLSNFSIENSFSFTVDKPLTSGTDNITITSGTFTKTISNYTSGSSISFTTAEKNSLYALNTTGTTIPLTITITTYNGSTNIGSNSYSCNGTFVATNPTFSGTINTSPSTLIEGQTTLSVTLSADATGTKGATITQYAVTVGSQTVTSATRTTFTFPNVRDNLVSVNVTDSRGMHLATPATKSITITPYSAPTITSAIVTRTPTPVSTSVQMQLGGGYSDVVASSLTAKYRYKQNGGSYPSTYTTVTLTKTNGVYSYTDTISGTFGMTYSYDFEIVIEDTYSTVTRTINLSSGRTTVDIDTANMRVGIGKFVENEDNQSLTVAGDIYEGNVKLANKYAKYEVISSPTVPNFTALINLIYPVGSIYLSVSSTSPETLFGGTWVKLQNRFLLGAGSSYTLGATGGEATHKLTEAEMPAHTHLGGHINVSMLGQTGGANWPTLMSRAIDDTTAYNNHTTSTGSSTAHNNMPPYLVVNMWKRTA